MLPWCLLQHDTLLSLLDPKVEIPLDPFRRTEVDHHTPRHNPTHLFIQFSASYAQRNDPVIRELLGSYLKDKGRLHSLPA